MGAVEKDTFVCIDCETTGLDVNEDRIIEIALVVFTFDQTLAEYESLVDPKREVPAESTAIHHITTEMVIGQPELPHVLPKVLELAADHTIVGHGIQFDIDVIHSEAKRHGISCSLNENRVIDTLRLARLYGGSPSNGLDVLRQHFNLPAQGAHRAMNDVLMNIGVFKHLCKGFKTTEAILKRLERPIGMRTMPLGKHKGRPFSEVPIEFLRWAAGKDFDQDLLYSIRSEIKRRKGGDGFAQAANPFQGL